MRLEAFFWCPLSKSGANVEPRNEHFMQTFVSGYLEQNSNNLPSGFEESVKVPDDNSLNK